MGTDAHLYDDPDDAAIPDLLDSRFDADKVDALKRLLALIAQGVDVSHHFPQVVKNVASQSLEVKKLVYLYLLHYAEKRQNEALLSINIFQKDLADINPLVRAWALRTMAGIRLHVVAPLVLLAVKKCARDPSPYVRKCAAFALCKLCDLLPHETAALQEIVDTLFADNSQGVVGAAAVAFKSVCPSAFALISKHFRRLCETLPDIEEWTQIILIEILLRYVIARHGLVKGSTLVALDTSTEIQGIKDSDARQHTRFCQENAITVCPFYDDFFINASDPYLTRALKLEILTSIATEQSIPAIFEEFQDYIKDPDRKFVADTVAAIALCAQKIPSISSNCIRGTFGSCILWLYSMLLLVMHLLPKPQSMELTHMTIEPTRGTANSSRRNNSDTESESSTYKSSSVYDSESEGADLTDTDAGSNGYSNDDDHNPQHQEDNQDAPLIHIYDAHVEQGQTGQHAEENLAALISTDLTELMSKSALESWLDEAPAEPVVQDSTRTSVARVSFTNHSFERKPKLHVLLDSSDSNGLSVLYAFSSDVSPKSRLLVCIDLYFENVTTHQLTDISIKCEGGSSSEDAVHQTPEGSPRCTFKDHLQKLDDSVDGEHTDKNLMVANTLASKILSNANFHLVSMDMPVTFNIDDASGLCWRFGSEIMSTSNACLITIVAEGHTSGPLDLTAKVNSEDTAFALNLLNRVVALLE
ncbi:hypothetical protein PR202_ga08161 [Eleusine coracana subsp. coracana]|uniref:AP-3 complex subunit beta C-terminal domain-containing protein n=1 Tax=Eleusine coracana subsp. coracana TaxID=191504 RepID=A0AAV5C1V8_ELECO|nr:hypothetical protein PR202_ga08161 [Eleusine coracana subsp. coracana]